MSSNLLKISFILIIAILLTSCKKDKTSSTLVSLGVDILYKDTHGANLLDPNNSKAYKPYEIKVHYIVNNKEVFYNYQKSEIYKTPDTIYGLTVYVNSEEVPENSTANTITYLELSPTDTDTIEAEIQRYDYSTVCKKAWYNGQFVDVYNGKGIEVIKNMD